MLTVLLQFLHPRPIDRPLKLGQTRRHDELLRPLRLDNLRRRRRTTRRLYPARLPSLLRLRIHLLGNGSGRVVGRALSRGDDMAQEVLAVPGCAGFVGGGEGEELGVRVEGVLVDGVLGELARVDKVGGLEGVRGALDLYQGCWEKLEEEGEGGKEGCCWGGDARRSAG